ASGLMHELRHRVPQVVPQALSPRNLIPRNWARQAPARGLRRVLLAGVTRPLLVSQVQTDVGGIEELPVSGGPVVLVANHASHLDTPLVLDSLPAACRRRTAVAVIPGSALTSTLRTVASAAALNTVPLHSDVCRELLGQGWNVLVFGEPSRSADGFVGDFTTDAAELAIERGVRVVPIGIRGSFAAMPRGRNRVVLG
ncbi:MAG: 1-acyl-sn-glycerol-3-phosphate acyltransferase, partial [Microlunatus sp.]|nr:1-acyl-sn-glycerol-3-phosphate acyltransferase [Microlunatus sp.]